MSKIEIRDEELENVTGGKITYTWNGSSGTIGINGNNPFVLLDKDAFVAYFNGLSAEDKKDDAKVLNALLAKGIIKKP